MYFKFQRVSDINLPLWKQNVNMVMLHAFSLALLYKAHSCADEAYS